MQNFGKNAVRPRELVDILKKSLDRNAPLFANQFIDTDDKVLGGIFTELANNLLLFATDDNIIKALSRSINSISTDDLENGEVDFSSSSEALIKLGYNLFDEQVKFDRKVKIRHNKEDVFYKKHYGVLIIVLLIFFYKS